MSKRTITLTGKPPVRLEDDNWPLLASASDKAFEGEYEFQSFRKANWFVGVRQHDDGRTIVYAIYNYETAYCGERNYSAKRGVLIAEKPDDDEICVTIANICEDIATCEHRDGDESRWDTLRDECIANLPAVDL